MPLLNLVASNPEAVCQLTIEKVVATASDGRLRDGTESQRELRESLRQVTVDALASYADYCLSNAFPKGGRVLQDLVNELGRRLEYDVTNGRYQGTTHAVGFDGIGRDPNGPGLVVEVKTTDALMPFGFPWRQSLGIEISCLPRAGWQSPQTGTGKTLPATTWAVLMAYFNKIVALSVLTVKDYLNRFDSTITVAEWNPY